MFTRLYSTDRCEVEPWFSSGKAGLCQEIVERRRHQGGGEVECRLLPTETCDRRPECLQKTQKLSLKGERKEVANLVFILSLNGTMYM